MDRKTSHWNNIEITKKISLEYKHKTEKDDWIDQLETIKKEDRLINDETLINHFPSVANKSFDNDQGFGYITENNQSFQSKVVVKGDSPFLSNQKEILSAELEDLTPYSAAYNINGRTNFGSNGRTIFIFRHYLHLPSLTGDFIDNIKVATANKDNQIEYHTHIVENGNIDRRFSSSKELFIKEEKYSHKLEQSIQTNIVNEVQTSTQLSEKRTHKKSSTTMALMDQMGQLIKPGVEEESLVTPGQVVINVHKAANLHKKGLTGKADPYVVLSLGGQKFKSQTVNNSQNPVWQYTAVLDVNEHSISELTIDIDIFDEDIGKDDFMGNAKIQPKDLLESSNEIVNSWINLTNCKSGKVLVSAKHVSQDSFDHELGKLNVTVHKARKIEKKSKFRTCDPYVVIKLGSQKQKSQTVKSNRNPDWEFLTSMYVLGNSPKQFSFEVFDDDIGKDCPLGNCVMDTSSLISKGKIKNVWVPLEDSKSGELLISAEFIHTVKPLAEVKHTKVESSIAETKKVTENVTSEIFSEELFKKENGDKKISFLEIKREVKNENDAAIQFINPLYLDDEFVVVEGFNANWFMVVSNNPNLPIRARLVPFKVLPDLLSPIDVFCLPGEGTHLIRKVISQHKPLAKCGYEKHCVLSNGYVYEFLFEDQDIIGRIEVRTWGREEKKIKIEAKYLEGKDFIETKMAKVGSRQVEVSGPISLYDQLTVDYKFGSYKLGS